jgi:hypothetical protein
MSCCAAHATESIDGGNLTQPLAKLNALDPHEVWPHEAHDFTPWLLDNSDALAEVLGIDIELTANEHPVGNFALDLIGHDLTNDCVLIVENQLTVTDHGHLGQILTYAAGTEAGTIVWMATGFREEHRQALDWLNMLAEGNARFFAVEIGAVQIADSPPAPLFRLRAQPNDWAAQVSVAARATAQATGKGVFYLQFWERLIERIQAEHPGWTTARKAGTANWLTLPSPFRSSAYLSMGFAAGSKLRMELYIDSQDAESVGMLYSFLFDLKNDIEAAYGSPLTWEELPGRRASRIADYSDGDVVNVDQHDEYIDWFFNTCGRLRDALREPAAAWSSHE